MVAAGLAVQGLNIIGGGWMRVYNQDPNTEASLQVVRKGRPLVERATAQGLTIVRHADFISHGHTPGTKNIDHFSGFKGDFPKGC